MSALEWPLAIIAIGLLILFFGAEEYGHQKRLAEQRAIYKELVDRLIKKMESYRDPFTESVDTK